MGPGMFAQAAQLGVGVLVYVKFPDVSIELLLGDTAYTPKEFKHTKAPHALLLDANKATAAAINAAHARRRSGPATQRHGGGDGSEAGVGAPHHLVSQDSLEDGLMSPRNRRTFQPTPVHITKRSIATLSLAGLEVVVALDTCATTVYVQATQLQVHDSWNVEANKTHTALRRLVHLDPKVTVLQSARHTDLAHALESHHSGPASASATTRARRGGSAASVRRAQQQQQQRQQQKRGTGTGKVGASHAFGGMRSSSGAGEFGGHGNAGLSHNSGSMHSMAATPGTSLISATTNHPVKVTLWMGPLGSAAPYVRQQVEAQQRHAADEAGDVGDVRHADGVGETKGTEAQGGESEGDTAHHPEATDSVMMLDCRLCGLRSVASPITYRLLDWLAAPEAMYVFNGCALCDVVCKLTM